MGLFDFLTRDKAPVFKIGIEEQHYPVYTNAKGETVEMTPEQYKNVQSESTPEDVSLTYGVATMPMGLGATATKGLATKLMPHFGKKIAQQTAEGIGGGLAGGTVMGGIDAAQNGENVPLGMLTGGTIGALTGGALGLGGGYIGKLAAKRGLYNNPLAMQSYLDDYIAGLDNNAPMGKSSRFSKELSEYQRLWQGVGKGSSEGQYDILADEFGNSINFYHATPNAGFTEFNPKSFFTKDIDYAKGYMDKNASALGFKKTADNPGVYEVNLDFNKPFDTRNPVDKNIFLNEYQAYYSPELTDRGMVDWMEVEDLADWLQEKYPQYDGIIADEGSYADANNFVKWKGESYIPFSGKQVKINKLITDKGEQIFNNPRQ